MIDNWFKTIQLLLFELERDENNGKRTSNANDIRWFWNKRKN